MNEENKQTKDLEQTIISVIGKVLVIPYNFSLVALSYMLWCYICTYRWVSTWNFDLPKTTYDYIIYFSLAAVVIGMLSLMELSAQITRLGLVTYMFAVVSLITSKQLDYISTFCNLYFITPLTLFSFFLMIKNIWLASATNQDKQTTKITKQE